MNAKWMLDNPGVNVAISRVSNRSGTPYSYVPSTKSWIGDQAGIAWEPLITAREGAFYGDSSDKPGQVRIASKSEAGACCGSKRGVARP